MKNIRKLLKFLADNPGLQSYDQRDRATKRAAAWLVEHGMASEPTPGQLDHPAATVYNYSSMPRHVQENVLAGYASGRAHASDLDNLRKAHLDHLTNQLNNYWNAYLEGVRDVMNAPAAPDLTRPKRTIWSTAAATVRIDPLHRVYYYAKHGEWTLFSEVGEIDVADFTDFFTHHIVACGSYKSHNWPYLADTLIKTITT